MAIKRKCCNNEKREAAATEYFQGRKNENSIIANSLGILYKRQKKFCSLLKSIMSFYTIKNKSIAVEMFNVYIHININQLKLGILNINF